MSTTKTAELAKILVDTTYYGWLINYAQITKMICEKEGIDFDEMWKFADRKSTRLNSSHLGISYAVFCLKKKNKKKKNKKQKKKKQKTKKKKQNNA